MGTNYYHVLCDTKRHIGKSSGGWCFSLHVYPEAGIHDLSDWLERWQLGEIFNGYGEKVSLKEMYKEIAERSNKFEQFTTERYHQNFAVPGPNGLVRSIIDPNHCIYWGNHSWFSTWDCFVGDFSLQRMANRLGSLS